MQFTCCCFCCSRDCCCCCGSNCNNNDVECICISAAAAATTTSSSGCMLMLQLHLHLQLVVVVVVMNESRLGLETRLFGSFLAAATLLLLFSAPLATSTCNYFSRLQIARSLSVSLHLCIYVSCARRVSNHLYLCVCFCCCCCCTAAVAPWVLTAFLLILQGVE